MRHRVKEAWGDHTSRSTCKVASKRHYYDTVKVPSIIGSMPIFLHRIREKFLFAEILLGSVGGSVKLCKYIRFYHFRANQLAKSQLEPMPTSSERCYCNPCKRLAHMFAQLPSRFVGLGVNAYIARNGGCSSCDRCVLRALSCAKTAVHVLHELRTCILGMAVLWF